MESKLLFTIPIYAMTKNRFTKSWETYYDYLRKSSIRKDPESIEETVNFVKQHEFPRNQYKYNQIMGYIEISLHGKDVIFEIWKSHDKRFYARSNSKHFIQWSPSNGLHFYVLERYTDADIKKEMKNMLRMIKRDFLKKGTWLDTESYDNQLELIDMRVAFDRFC